MGYRRGLRCGAFLALSVAATFAACSDDYGAAVAPGGTVDAGTDAENEVVEASDSGCTAPALDRRFLGDAIAIDTSGPFACALRQGGQVVCWGANDVGQLGTAPTPGLDGGTAEAFSARPLAVPGLPPATQIATGYAHACAVVDNGQVWCWGDGRKGQAGAGGASPISAPTRVISDLDQPLDNVVAVSGGGTFTCALMRGGGVQCWGDNSKLQLGSSFSGGSSPFPVPVPGLAPSATVAAGFFHACALVIGVGARCWGGNDSGELGVAGPGDGGGLPPTAYGPSGLVPTLVRASSPDTCVVDAQGSVICSGYNLSGQLGATSPGGSIRTPFPIPELGTKDIEDIDVGPAHSCGRRVDGTAFCMSGLAMAALGRGPLDAAAVDHAARPVLGAGPDPLRPVGSVKVGGAGYGSADQHTCAIVKPACAPDGQVYCWGKNSRGQAGDGTTMERDRPVMVVAP